MNVAVSYFWQNDGQDEVVVCAWDGTTYVLDHLRNVVRFKFEDNVCAGKGTHKQASALLPIHLVLTGSLDLAQNITSTVSSTLIFSRKIFIYHNINLPAIPPSNVITTMATQVRTFTSSLFALILVLLSGFCLMYNELNQCLCLYSHLKNFHVRFFWYNLASH